MSYIQAFFHKTIPTKPGIYRHRVFGDKPKDHCFFIGYVDKREKRNQGISPVQQGQQLRCCPPNQTLTEDCKTPAEWDGWWQTIKVYKEL